MRLLRRIILGLLAIGVIAVAVPLINFTVWYLGLVSEQVANSEIANTSLGEVEYAIVGEGTPYLYLHGTPGGYDQSLIGQRISPDLYQDHQIIAVSRPGYLRTPLESGATFEEQADLFMALLDGLGIEKTVVYAASGGGYAGVQTALRHPDRVLALILFAPAIGYEALSEDANPGSEAGIRFDFLYWSNGENLMSRFISEYDPNDPHIVEWTKELIRAAMPSGTRSAGIANDFRQRNYPEIDNWPVEQLGVPTLILHGNADRNSDYKKSVDLAARIPNATLITFPDGDHFISITRTREIRDEISRFVDLVLSVQ